MTFAFILYDIIILPIEFIIEFVFCFVLDKFEKFGVAGAILAVSLVVNFLALPIYNVADEIQIKERNLQKKMKRWVTHIKTHFKGDEQFMMLSEYYRQNNYHPLYALRQSLSILIQIPFFMAAYNFLSKCQLLENQSILFLKNLSKPDGLITIGVIALNLLPILMTAINVVSALIYTKDAPLREKMQAFLLAGIFLVLLYDSPSGLVFYWVLNQIFSLCKNIVKKTKYPGRIVYGFISIIMIVLCCYVLLFKSSTSISKKIIFSLITLIFVFTPFLLKSGILQNVFSKLKKLMKPISDKQNFTVLLFSCISLCLLCGFLLPSNVISTSPSEFSFLGSTDSPLSYIWSAFAFFAGLFVFWPIVIYKMFSDNEKVRLIMPPMFFVLTFCALANAFLFKYDYGTISIFFMTDKVEVFKNTSFFYLILPCLFMLFIIAGVFCLTKYNKCIYLVFIMLAISIAEITQGTIKITEIGNATKELIAKKDKSNIENSNLLNNCDFHFSKTNHNVVILFLDCAVSSFFPYILEQFPEMSDDYDGFIFYPNCLSFSNFTNGGTPAMFGGYDYTIDEIDKREKELLKTKQNEALLVMPKIFSDAGFSTKLHEAPYINYEDEPIPSDFDITEISYNSQSNINKYIDNMQIEFGSPDKTCNSSLKHFVIMQVIYPPLRETFSNQTNYYIANKSPINRTFIKSFASLYYLAENFDVNSEKPTFTFIGNGTTHEAVLLRENYEPGVIDKNHPASGAGFYDWNSSGNAEYNLSSYHSNVAAHIQVVKFLHSLKEKGIYDNTRIIIVSDHGNHVSVPELHNNTSHARLNPLLIFKDFNAHGKLSIDNSLKTNADTVYFAIKNLDVSDVNPFTNSKIKSSDDFESFNVYFLSSPRLAKFKGFTQFKKNISEGYTVHTNIFNESNWKKLDPSEDIK